MSRSKVLMIVGADRVGGVSSALAQLAAQRGYSLELIGRHADSAERLLELLRDARADVRLHIVDACNEQKMQEVADDVLTFRGQVGALVVTACDASGPVGGVGDQDVNAEAIKEGFWGNFGPAWVTSQVLVPRMAAQADGGRLLFVSSLNAYRSQFRQLSYAVGKIPLEPLARDITTQYCSKELWANVLVLTTVNTNTPRRNELRSRYPHFDEAVGRFISPYGRQLTDFQVARNILLLINPDCLLMGQVIYLDGGADAAGGCFTFIEPTPTAGENARKSWFEVACHEFARHNGNNGGR